MEYRIGKANIYYTLWTVTEIGNTLKYEYQKNLSKDLEKAKSKAPEGTVYDETIKGSRSFVREKNESNSNSNGTFKFGKYKGLKIAECTDIEYIVWSYNSIDWEDRSIARQILENNNYLVLDNGLVFTPEEVAKRPDLQELKNVPEVTKL